MKPDGIPDDGAPLHLFEEGVWLPFWPPYRCIGCGVEIEEGQFRFSCCCGPCDLGMDVSHDALSWDGAPSRAETYRRFSEAHRPT